MPETDPAALLKAALAPFAFAHPATLRTRYTVTETIDGRGPALADGSKPNPRPSKQMSETLTALGPATAALKMYLDGPPPPETARDELCGIVGHALRVGMEQISAVQPYVHPDQLNLAGKGDIGVSVDLLRDMLAGLAAALEQASSGPPKYPPETK